MKSYYLLPFLLCFCLLAACQTGTQQDTPTTNTPAETKTVEPTATAPASGASDTKEKEELKPQDNRVIVLGKSVGAIGAAMTEKDLIQIFGEEKVIRGAIPVGEGETIEGTVVFPNSPDELHVLWQDESFSKIESIGITKPDNTWKTQEGVRFGTNLEQLATVNGQPITFAGFEWDYAGNITNFNGGHFDAKGLGLSLFEGDDNQGLIGDKEFKSDKEGLDLEGFVVREMRISF